MIMAKMLTSPPRKQGVGQTAQPALLDSCSHGNDALKKRVMVLAVVLVALAVAGCGKKGQPSPPPGVPNTYPQNYPAQ
jgi:predicted small lipoprotein YifL